MKARIDENGYFLGIYTDEFLTINSESLGVNEWILTDVLPNEFFLKARLVDGIFLETASEAELKEYYGTV